MSSQFLHLAASGAWSTSPVMATAKHVSRTFTTNPENGDRQWVLIERNVSRITDTKLVLANKGETFALPIDVEAALEAEANSALPTLNVLRHWASYESFDHKGVLHPIGVTIDVVQQRDTVGGLRNAQYNGSALTLVTVTIPDEIAIWTNTPQWLGEEVTDDQRFTAENLIAYPWHEFGRYAPGLSPNPAAGLPLPDLP